MGMLNRILPPSEKAVFEAEGVVMRGPIFRDPAGWSFGSCSLRHQGARSERREQLVRGLEPAGRSFRRHHRFKGFQLP
jgi:hypothetical protein